MDSELIWLLNTNKKKIERGRRSGGEGLSLWLYMGVNVE